LYGHAASNNFTDREAIRRTTQLGGLRVSGHYASFLRMFKPITSRATSVRFRFRLDSDHFTAFPKFNTSILNSPLVPRHYLPPQNQNYSRKFHTGKQNAPLWSFQRVNQRHNIGKRGKIIHFFIMVFPTLMMTWLSLETVLPHLLFSGNCTYCKLI
jgi:hypothetical protein